MTRTTRDIGGLLRRVATTYQADSVGDSCKVSLGQALNEIVFRMSDGDATFKGVFTRVAETAIEQEISCRLIGHCHKQRCEEARRGLNTETDERIAKDASGAIPIVFAIEGFHIANKADVGSRSVT